MTDPGRPKPPEGDLASVVAQLREVAQAESERASNPRYPDRVRALSQRIAARMYRRAHAIYGALHTLERVRAAYADIIEQRSGCGAWGACGDEYEEGMAEAYDHAAVILRAALGPAEEAGDYVL